MKIIFKTGSNSVGITCYRIYIGKDELNPKKYKKRGRSGVCRLGLVWGCRLYKNLGVVGQGSKDDMTSVFSFLLYFVKKTKIILYNLKRAKNRTKKGQN